MSRTELHESGKIAVALRTARAAVGWNQEEFAQRMGVEAGKFGFSTGVLDINQA